MTYDFTDVDKKFDDIFVGPDVEYLREFIHIAITDAVEKALNDERAKVRKESAATMTNTDNVFYDEVDKAF